MHVSVVIPVYNAAEFLKESIESVVAERKHGVKEIIVVEDGSLDSSYEVAEQLRQRFPDLISLFRHPGGVNRGAGATRNLGVKKATGAYICFLDADDYWLPDRLRAALHTFEKNPGIDGVYDSALLEFDNRAAKAQFNGMATILGTQKRIEPGKLFERIIKDTTAFHMNTILLKYESFTKVGLFNEELRRGQDMELFLRLAARLKLIHSKCSHPVAVVRRHDRNRWNPDKKHRYENISIAIAVYEAVLSWATVNPIDPYKKKLIYRQLIFLYGHLGQFQKAWHTARRASNGFYIFYAWKYHLPGPRSIRLLTCEISKMIKNRISYRP